MPLRDLFFHQSFVQKISTTKLLLSSAYIFRQFNQLAGNNGGRLVGDNRLSYLTGLKCQFRGGRNDRQNFLSECFFNFMPWNLRFGLCPVDNDYIDFFLERRREF